MKKLIIILHFSFFIIFISFGQQYNWTTISANLPKFYRDTTIINGGADTIIASISGISFLDDNHGWICTGHPFDADPSAILETNDGGQTWTEHSAPFSGSDIHMIDELNGYFGANNGFIYKTNDGAQTWTLHGMLTVALYDLGFPPRPAQNGWAGGYNGHLSQITPDGVFPIDLGLAGHVYCIDFPSEERGYALLDYQMIINYMDGQWNDDAAYPYSSKTWLFFYNDTLGWCVGEMFLKTTVGNDWYRTDPDFVQTGSMTGVYFIDENKGWAVGTQGQIAYSNDGGEDWTMLEHSLTDAYLQGVYFTSPNRGYIYGGNKTLLKYTLAAGLAEHGGMDVQGDVEVFPNPTTGKFTFTNNKNPDMKIRNLELLDLYGKSIYNWHPALGTRHLEKDISHLPAGIYFIRVLNVNQTIVKKILKI